MKNAIVVVAYNRIDSLKRLLGSLDDAYYGDCSPTLIISVDKSKTDVVEHFADEYQWSHGEKIVDKHEQNLGLRNHMMSLGKWFERFESLVVLEDDIVVSPNYYTYTCQTVAKYNDCEAVAGISLYGFSINYQTGMPFIPIKDENDVYFMNCAMSWGEVWMRDSWKRFYMWYLNHQEFPILPHLPRAICSWNQKSWLKYHTRYCIEENKYFVHPYLSLTTNYSDIGEHSIGGTVNQVPIQNGRKTHFQLPDFNEGCVCYDGFFENKSLYNILGYTTDMLCLDLQGGSHNNLKKRYWLTNEVANYKVVKSFGLNYRPIETNIIFDNHGDQIYLYDTTVFEKNNKRKNHKSLLYSFHVGNMFVLMLQYGFFNIWHDFLEYLSNKVK